MDVFLAGEDSLRLMRYVRASEDYVLEPLTEEGLRAVDTRLDPRALRALRAALPMGASGDKPLHLTFFSRKSRSRARSVEASVHLGELPDGAYLQVLTVDGSPLASLPQEEVRLFVESPGLSMASAARGLMARVSQGAMTREAAVARLAGYGMELCGTYARDAARPSAQECVYGVEVLSTADELRAFLGDLKGAPGILWARSAACYVRDASGSPAETLVSLGIRLPARLGGAHLPEPLANALLEWPDGVEGLLNHKSMHPDFFWPQYLLACEVNGHVHEESLRAVEEDNNRIQDYQVCGITIIPVRRSDMRSPEAFERLLARLVHVMEPFEGPAFKRHAREVLTDPDVRRARAVLLSQLRPPCERFSR